MKKIFEVTLDANGEDVFLGKPDTKCKFCNQNIITSNTKIAHAIPELLGNKKIFSYIECNNCNEYFGNNLERHLDNFLGIKRTLYKTMGKKNIPSTVLDKKKENIQTIRFNPRLNTLQVPILKESNLVFIDRKTKTCIFRNNKKPYTPTYVYKALSKIAFSLLEDISGYEYLSDYVLASNEEVPYPIAFDYDFNCKSQPFITKIYGFKEALIGNQYTFFGVIPFPKNKVFLFEFENENIKYIILSICIGNYVIQLPFYPIDSLMRIKDEIVKSGKLNLNITFPSVTNLGLEKKLNQNVKYQEINLSSLDSIKDEEDNAYFSYQEIIDLDEKLLSIKKNKLIYGELKIKR